MMNLLTKQQKTTSSAKYLHICNHFLLKPPSITLHSPPPISFIRPTKAFFANLLFVDEMSKQYKYYDLLLYKHIRTDKCEPRIAGYSKI